MNIGILMSGQGAQKVGMATDLYANLPAYRATIDRASAVLGYDLQATVNMDEARLNQTAYAQAAILAMSVGIYNTLADILPEPKATLGLSLGEYSALTIAGVFDFEQAIAIVRDRGAYMQKAGEVNPGKMVAAMTEDQTMVVDVLSELAAAGKRVYPANYNTFNQLVFGGVAADVDVAMEVLAANGVKRLIELPVTGAFHTPLLNSAAENLANRLAGESFGEAHYPVYSNTTGRAFIDVHATLLEQITAPTYFAQALQNMVKDVKVDTLIEFGPSDTLSKFARKVVDKTVNRYSVSDMASYEKLRNILETQV